MCCFRPTQPSHHIFLIVRHLLLILNKIATEGLFFLHFFIAMCIIESRNQNLENRHVILSLRRIHRKQIRNNKTGSFHFVPQCQDDAIKLKSQKSNFILFLIIMSHSVSNSNQFLSYYNQMDEFFTILLDVWTYIPFSEKIDQIVQWHYSVSSFVKQHYHKLKYFSEMRNQIVHGFRLDHEHYLLASDVAVKAIKNLTEHLVTPPTIAFLSEKTIPQLFVKQTVQETITILLHHHLRALPLYDNDVYVTTLSLDYLAWLLLQWWWEKLIEEKLPWDVLAVLFLSPTTSVYTIESLFLKQHPSKPIEVIWISEDWTSDSPIIGKITPQDLPKLYQMSILSEII
jgi:hypothetical protein